MTPHTKPVESTLSIDLHEFSSVVIGVLSSILLVLMHLHGCSLYTMINNYGGCENYTGALTRRVD